MPILIAIATVIAGVLIWTYRIRAAREAMDELSGVASDVMAAARRLGFRRKYESHPVDCIEEGHIAAGALSVAFLELGPRQTNEDRDLLLRALQTHLGISMDDAKEILVLGPWFVNECNGPIPAVSRLGRRLRALGGNQALDPVLQVINEVAGAQDGLNDTQRDALHDLSNIFRRS